MPNNFSVPVSIFKEGKSFVAYTHVLDLFTSADTLVDVKKRFVEIVNLFFDELDKMGTTTEVLESLGWERIDDVLQPPIEVEHETQTFNLPARP